MKELNIEMVFALNKANYKIDSNNYSVNGKRVEYLLSDLEGNNKIVVSYDPTYQVNCNEELISKQIETQKNGLLNLDRNCKEPIVSNERIDDLDFVFINCKGNSVAFSCYKNTLLLINFYGIEKGREKLVAVKNSND